MERLKICHAFFIKLRIQRVGRIVIKMNEFTSHFIDYHCHDDNFFLEICNRHNLGLKGSCYESKYCNMQVYGIDN